MLVSVTLLVPLADEGLIRISMIALPNPLDILKEVLKLDPPSLENSTLASLEVRVMFPVSPDQFSV